MSPPSVVSVEAVTRRYRLGRSEVLALDGLSLEVPAGEFLSVTGPSGSGKSTLLNMMAGLDRPDAGRVRVAGADLEELSDDARSALRLRRIGFVFQAFHLFPTFTVEENVLWPLEFLGASAAEASRRAAEALDAVTVPSSARRRRPNELSGGEQQRVAIARALATDPVLLLADEPTGNLDSRTSQTILDLLRRLNDDRRLTIVMVTHNTLASTYGHRTIELRDGRIVHESREASRVRPHLVRS